MAGTPLPPLAERSRITYRFEVLRSPFTGIITEGWQTFALLVAIRVFDAPELFKSFIASANAIGNLLTPLVLYFLSRTVRTSAQMLIYLWASVAVTLIFTAFWPGLWGFTFWIVMGQLIAAQTAPLILNIYSKNFRHDERGSKLSLAFMITAVSGALFCVLSGRLLDISIEWYRPLYLLMAGAGFTAAALYRKIPSEPLESHHLSHPVSNFKYAYTDRLFGRLLLSWMFMGLANLMMLPLRVEYMANPEYGLNFSNEKIALVTVFLPAVARMFSTHFWGRLFDRMNFLTLRAIVNALFLASIVLFFNTHSFLLLCVSALLIGLAFGGGGVMWTLWVTKVAPPEKVSAYMGIHVSLTGLRGVIAPFLGFYLLAHYTPPQVSYVAIALTILSMWMFKGVRQELDRRSGEFQKLTF